jgi:hypothetical protein
MISGPDTGKPRFALRVALALVLVLALLPQATRAERDITAPSWGIPELMATLRQVRAGSARFVERRYLQVMTAPLQSSGILRYVAPDRLEKQTLLPQPGRLTIAGDQLTVERQGETTREVSLQDHPDIGALVAGVRATMAGDLATLTRLYTLSLQGNVTAWQLGLEPKDRHMRELVTAIVIKGSWNALSSVETTESDGDRSEMTIDPDPQ